MAGSLGFYSFPLFSIPEFLWLLINLLVLATVLLGACSFPCLGQEAVALCLNSSLAPALENQGTGVRLEQGPRR